MSEPILFRHTKEECNNIALAIDYYVSNNENIPVTLKEELLKLLVKFDVVSETMETVKEPEVQNIKDRYERSGNVCILKAK